MTILLGGYLPTVYFWGITTNVVHSSVKMEPSDFINKKD